MTTLENRQGAGGRPSSDDQPIISSNEYEVSNLYDSSLALPEDQDGMLQPVMHILREETSEAEDFDAALSDSEKYKLVDDMSEDFTVDPVDLQESSDSEDSDIDMEKRTSAARKQYTFHEYTQAPSSKNLVVKRMDESSGPVVCRWNDCNNKYDSPEELSKHLDFQHDLSDWICHWNPCSRNLKPFDARYKLIVHLRCHTGEKPYKCTIPGCLRRFSRIENMRLHVRTHTGEKPYACGYEGCPKRFNNSSDRAKHVKTHVQTKPYKCKFPGCDKHYTDPSSMRKHFRSIHYPSEQAKQNKTNLRIHDYSPALPAKQPRLVSTTTVTPANTVGMTDATLNSQVTSVMINNNGNNNGNNKILQVPVFQLPPRDEPVPGQSNMSQLIQEGKIQPILLKNGDQQSMLMFVPTANMHEATGPGVTMIPVLPQTSQPQQQQSKSTPHNTSTHTTTSNKMTDTTDQPVRPAKNVRVIVSSGKTKEQQTDNSESSTSSSS